MSQANAAATAAPAARAIAVKPAIRCFVLVSYATWPAASALSTAISSSRYAQANSSASIARPIGMTARAGPGRTSIATPARKTVKPASANATR